MKNLNFKKLSSLIQRQRLEVQAGGFPILLGKGLTFLLTAPALVVILAIRVLAPVVLIRFGLLISTRIGHFASNTELYLCERDANIHMPKRSHVDIFFALNPICNQQLAKMWKRMVIVWPDWIRVPIYRANRLIPDFCGRSATCSYKIKHHPWPNEHWLHTQ